MKKDDIYRLLNLNEQAPAELVKRTFRKFVRNNHPDFFPGDMIREERFKRVNAAYHNWKLIQHTISNIRRLRSVYGQPPSGGFRPWSFSCEA